MIDSTSRHSPALSPLNRLICDTENLVSKLEPALAKSWSSHHSSAASASRNWRKRWPSSLSASVRVNRSSGPSSAIEANTSSVSLCVMARTARSSSLHAEASARCTRLKSTITYFESAESCESRRSNCSVEPKNRAPCASSTATLLGQERALFQRAQAVRAHQVGAVIAAQDAAHIGAVVKGVELELARDLLADADAAHAVALRIDRRRVDADADLARDHGDDATRDTAFRRHADLIGPFARVIVHAARVHHRQHVTHMLRIEDQMIGDGVPAVIGERRRHDREIGSSHIDRALAEIEVEHLVWIALNHRRVEHHVSDGAVAMPGRQLRFEHGFVDAQLPPGKAREQVEHVGDALVLSLAEHHLGDGDRA